MCVSCMRVQESENCLLKITRDDELTLYGHRTQTDKKLTN